MVISRLKMSSFSKSEQAVQKLSTLNALLDEHQARDQEEVITFLTPKEQRLYLSAKSYYAKGSAKNYG